MTAREEAYARAALERACTAVAAARPGARATTVFREALGIGSLLHLALFAESVAFDTLVSFAPTGNDFTLAEARGHVGHGLKRGAKRPRSLPEPNRSWRRPVATESTPPTPMERRALPEAEARRFWGSCASVVSEDVVASWLRSRSLEPEAVATWNLARAVHSGFLPGWARHKGRSWSESKHLVVLPLFDDRGRMRGFRARCVEESQWPKTLSAAGFSSSGLVFACPLARQLLRIGHAPTWWGDAPLVVHVAEGGPDFLTLASRTCEECEHAPIVLGVVSGSWTPTIASRIPAGARVVLAPHPGAAGRHYATTVGESLLDRCDVEVVRAGTHR